jgi:DNA-binding response OmpR family regulator
MKVLVADDDPVICFRLEHLLSHWGHDAVVVGDGVSACEQLESAAGPPMGIVDWMLPGMDGLEVCSRARAARPANPPYWIMLTAKTARQEKLTGLRDGADGFLTKPYDDELHAHLNVGERIVRLQQGLADQVAKLQDALAQVRTLRGLLPICVYCKKVRADEAYWQQVEAYVASRSDAEFTHTI